MISSQNHICYDERCTAAFKFYFDEHGILLKGKIIMLAPDTESVLKHFPTFPHVFG